MTDEPTGEETIEDEPQGFVEDEAPAETPEGPDWKALSRKNETKAKKANAELKELRDRIANMLSPDEVADKDAALAEARANADAALIEATRFRVALTEGIPLELAVRLQGATEDEMREDAERLKELVKPQAGLGSTDARKATNPPPNVDPPDANDLLRQIVAGKR